MAEPDARRRSERRSRGAANKPHLQLQQQAAAEAQGGEHTSDPRRSSADSNHPAPLLQRFRTSGEKRRRRIRRRRRRRRRRRMLWGLTLAVAVVCVGGMKADVMSRLILPRDYGVKLCGREFIRAVIFTCGGSRWKRSTEGDLDPNQWSPLSYVPVEDNQQTWQPSSELTADAHSPLRVASLADLLALFRAVGVGGERSLGDLLERSQPSLVLGERDGNPAAADESVTNRWKRNFSLGVAGKCCSQGCTKNDIGRLC